MSKNPKDAVEKSKESSEKRKNSRLTERQKIIMRHRSGHGGGKDHTLDKAADASEKTRERIKKIEENASRKVNRRSKKLKDYLD